MLLRESIPLKKILRRKYVKVECKFLRMARIFKGRSLKHQIARIVPIIVLWKIWKERCRRMFDQKSERSVMIFKHICQSVKNQPILMMCSQQNVADQDIIDFITLKSQVSLIDKGMWIGWTAPLAE